MQSAWHTAPLETSVHRPTLQSVAVAHFPVLPQVWICAPLQRVAPGTQASPQSAMLWFVASIPVLQTLPHD
jgi:hypothetical protein